MDYWLESCRKRGISREVGVCGLKGVARKTLVTYQKCWSKFSSWVDKWVTGYSGVTVNIICEFLLFLFRSKTSTGGVYSGDALNLHRSALSFFLKLEIPDLGYDPSVTRLFSYFYKSRPSFPRYTVTWDVGRVLRVFGVMAPACNSYSEATHS